MGRVLLWRNRNRQLEDWLEGEVTKTHSDTVSKEIRNSDYKPGRDKRTIKASKTNKNRNISNKYRNKYYLT